MISLISVDVNDAQKLIGNKAMYEGHEIEIIEVRRYYAIVKRTDDGKCQKIVWGKLLSSNKTQRN